MNIEQLKALNKPENLIENYQLQLPFYGLPPETLQQLLTMLSAIAKELAPMRAEVSQLPTWQNLQEMLFLFLSSEKWSTHTN